MRSRHYTAHYSLIQAAYCLGLGGVFAFNTVYLTSRGIELSQIGYLLAASNALSIGLQLSISSLISKPGAHRDSLKRTVIIMAFLSLITSLALSAVSDTAVLSALVLFGISYVFSSAMQPFLTSLSMECINSGIPVNFGLARGLGSMCYAAMTFILGRVVKANGAAFLPYIHVVCYGLLAVLVFVFKLPVTKVKPVLRAEKRPSAGVMSFIKTYRRFVVFLIGVVLIFFCGRMVSTYLISIIDRAGGDSSDIGAVQAIAAIVEFPVMVFFTRIALKIDIKRILQFAGIFYSIKAASIILSTGLGTIYLGHFLQIFAFALLLPALTYYINGEMKEEHRLMGQSLGTAAMTFGDVLGALCCSLLPRTFGLSMSSLLLVGLCVSVVGSITIFGAFFEKKKKEAEKT